MVIQHNLAALNSHRNMGINNSKTSKNLEKLSSGYKVNRAGDDAAGLAISEKMRGQIRGLAMAEQNVSNGISLIQTAEGGLNETHAILQRMRELSVQSANGTYVEGVDRVQLEKEFTAIKSEIDRISQATAYNGINLLDGSLGVNSNIPTVRLTNGVTNGTTGDIAGVTATKDKVVFTAAAALAAGDVYSLSYTTKDGGTKSMSYTVTAADVTGTGGVATDLNKTITAFLGKDSTIKGTVATSLTAVVTIDAVNEGSKQITDFSATIVKAGTTAVTTISPVHTAGVDQTRTIDLTSAANTSKYLEIDGRKFQLVADDSQLESGYEALYVAIAGQADAAFTDTLSIVGQLNSKGFKVTTTVDAAGKADSLRLSFGAKSGKGLEFQIGANGSKDQRVDLSVGNMNSNSIGTLDAKGKITASVAGTSIATQDSAKLAIEVIENAINQVSGTRADLGALQNRLEHTMNNLGVTKENITAAESSIRDVDMAKEMMEFTKNNILVQASQAMLAQANQLPQGVLSLLR